jgi:hypothetical protein
VASIGSAISVSNNGTKPTIRPDGGLWSGPKIARWLAKFHGVQVVHDQRGWNALIAVRYSIQSHELGIYVFLLAGGRVRSRPEFASRRA